MSIFDKDLEWVIPHEFVNKLNYLAELLAPHFIYVARHRRISASCFYRE